MQRLKQEAGLLVRPLLSSQLLRKLALPVVIGRSSKVIGSAAALSLGGAILRTATLPEDLVEEAAEIAKTALPAAKELELPVIADGQEIVFGFLPGTERLTLTSAELQTIRLRLLSSTTSFSSSSSSSSSPPSSPTPPTIPAEPGTNNSTTTDGETAPEAEQPKRWNIGRRTVQFVSGVASGIASTFQVTLRFIRHLLLFVPVAAAWPVAWLVGGGVYDRWKSWLVWAVRNSGACAIKLAQWLATRPDLRKGPRHSWAATNRALSVHLSQANEPRAIDDYFVELDQTPIACGAIAQVYKARLYSGETVAIKVRHPGVDGGLVGDLKLIRLVARLLNGLPFLRSFDLPVLAARFSEVVEQQSDLRLEAINLLDLHEQSQSFPLVNGRASRGPADLQANMTVGFPLPIGAVTADVLVETFCEGEPIRSYFDAATSPAVRSKLAFLSLSFFFNMLHSDSSSSTPLYLDFHPNNMLVVPSSDGNPKLWVVDAGVVTRLTAQERQSFRRLVAAVTSNDGQQCADLLASSAANEQMGDKQRKDFTNALTWLCTQRTLSPSHSLVSTLQQCLAIAREHSVHVGPHLYEILTTLISLEGLAVQLDSDTRVLNDVTKLMLGKSPQLLNVLLPAGITRAGQRVMI